MAAGPALISAALIGGIYMIPSIIAHSRQHFNAPAITITNLLLGWSGLGWVICLIWAFTNQPESPTLHRNHRSNDNGKSR